MIKYILMLAVCGIPLVFNPSYIDGYNLPKITLFYLATLSALALWLIPQLRQGCLRIKVSSLFAWAFLWILANLTALVFSIDPVQSFWGQYEYYSYGFLPLITALVFAFLISQAGVGRKVFGWAVFGAVLSTFYAFLIFDKNTRVNTTFGSPIYYSAYLACIIPVVLAGSLESKNRLVWLVSLAILSAGLIIAASRGAWVAIGISILVFLFVALTRKQLNIKRFSPVLAGIALIGVILFFNSAQWNKIRAGININELSDISRYEGWRSGLEVFKEDPLTGAGPANFSLAFIKHKSLNYARVVGAGYAQGHAHNDIIQVAATTGLVGLSAYFIFWTMLFIKGWQNAKNSLFDTSIIAALVAIFIYNQFNNGMVPELMLFWMIVGWVAGTDKKAKSYAFSVPKPGLMVPLFLLLTIFTAHIMLKPIRAEMKYIDGNMYAVKGDLKTAFADFEGALKIRCNINEYHKAVIELGHIIASQSNNDIEKRKYVEAIQRHAEENAVINSSDPDAHFNLGVVYIWRFQLLGEDFREKAKVSLGRALELDRYSVNVLTGLAKLSFLSGKPEKAKEYYLDVLEIDPKNAEALTAVDKGR